MDRRGAHDRPAAPAALATALALAGLLAGCATTTPTPAAPPVAPAASADDEAAAVEAPTVRVASLKGPTTMGLVGLMDDDAHGRAAQDYELTMHGTPDEVVPLVVQGGVDVALVPANLASVLHHRTATDDGPQVQVAAVTTLGTFELVENGGTVDDLADLAGRTVYSSGKGASPEYVLNHLLRGAGLEPGVDVAVEYRSEHAEVAALVAGRPGSIGVLPQPFATAAIAQSPALRTAVRLADVWEAAEGTPMVTGVVVVRTAFAREHPDALATFLADLEASTALTNADPATAAALVADAGILGSAALAEAAIPVSGITYLDGAEMRSALDAYLRVLAAADPASVGGSVPDELYVDP
ncbi:MqnA/MqnD/SBP family protein [Actinotalea sp. AC32]|nr:MqnA/MqnD/SBP family protein [Actinotalea sp. AC32]